MDEDKKPVFSAEDFLAEASSLKTEFVTAEELGLSRGVWIRELNGYERERIMALGGKVTLYDDDRKEIDMRDIAPGASAKIAMMALVTDEAGSKQMFRPNQEKDLQRLGSRVLDVISKRVRKLSGMTDESAAEAKKKSASQSSDDGLN